MTVTWSADELHRIGMTGELHIAVKQADGTLHRWTPIWVVCADDHVYVRTWYRRGTGWFGQVLTSRRARIHIPGLVADITVEDVGDGPGALRDSIDTAYRTKYGEAGSNSMVTTAAAATSLRLDPDRDPHRS